jgi:heme-degrading monooxygenase HmoA
VTITIRHDYCGPSNVSGGINVAIMLSRRKLNPGEFAAWKTRFEQDAPNRKRAGCRGVQRFRGISDPDELIVIFDWEDRQRAEEFVASKIAGVPAVRDAKRPDGTSAFVNEFYEAMEPLES